ncbi:uncharacterized protein CMC5_014310 [Chondromyces crocatus]|uniref:PEGA domain-containing protein n=2 Tax=Chondromyces crocatus TaxID=52 RepID=A0A0K1E8V7_CHOCO|nr:uncharacterized protein CMC5_014310 [Chondromyces crocatus]
MLYRTRWLSRRAGDSLSVALTLAVTLSATLTPSLAFAQRSESPRAATDARSPGSARNVTPGGRPADATRAQAPRNPKATTSPQKVDGAKDTASAAALFDRGMAAMAAGRFEAGCKALADSQRLDPQPETLFTLAACEAGRGRVATATSLYDEYLALYEGMTRAEKAGQRQRPQVAQGERDRLRAEIPMLTVSLPAQTPAGTVVTWNGEVLGPDALNQAVPVDPGEHLFSTQAPGVPSWEGRVTIKPKQKKHVTLRVNAPKAPTKPAVRRQALAPATPPTATLGLMAYLSTLRSAFTTPLHAAFGATCTRPFEDGFTVVTRPCPASSVTTAAMALAARLVPLAPVPPVMTEDAAARAMVHLEGHASGHAKSGLQVGHRAVGGVRGALALHAKGSVEKHCRDTVTRRHDTACDASGMGPTERVKGSGSSAVGLAAGATGLVSAAVTLSNGASVATAVEGSGASWTSSCLLAAGPDGAWVGAKGAW